MDRRGGGELIGDLREQERERFALRTAGSRELFKRAANALAGGVTSSFHGQDPWPVYIERGEGARIWDVDGNEYVDFHNGFSAMVQGHAHPAIVAAVRERAALGTHFGAHHRGGGGGGRGARPPLRPALWRFTNSGTEANMAAVSSPGRSPAATTLIRMAGYLPRAHGHRRPRGSLQRRRGELDARAIERRMTKPPAAAC